MTDGFEEVAARARATNRRAFTNRLHEFIRGGLPGASLPSGSRGAEVPLPLLNGADVNFLAVLAQYDEAWQTVTTAMSAGQPARALRALDRIVELETGYIPEWHLTSEQLAELHRKMARAAVLEVSSRAADCANCGRPVEQTPDDRLRSGRCFNCWRWRREHDGQERPKELWEQDVERDSRSGMLPQTNHALTRRYAAYPHGATDARL